MEKIIIFIAVIIIALGIYAIVTMPPCKHSHREVIYHAPMYVKSGNMMLPIGGGTRNAEVCDSR